MWMALDTRLRSGSSTGVMRNVKDHSSQLSHPTFPRGTPPLAPSSAAVDDSAPAVRGAAGKFADAPPLRGTQIDGRCARFGAATGARPRARALAPGMRGVHAAVVCGQGVDLRSGVARNGGRGKPGRPYVTPGADLGAVVSGGRGRWRLL